MMHHIGHSRAADHDIDQALHACTAQLLYRIDHAMHCTCMETINRARMIDNPGQFPQILKTHYGWGIIAVYVWKQVPFMTLAIYAVLLGIGRETEEAAEGIDAFFAKRKAAWMAP